MTDGTDALTSARAKLRKRRCHSTMSPHPAKDLNATIAAAPAYDLAPAENISIDTGGFSQIMLLAHPLAIVYITSCHADSRIIYVSPQISRLGFSAESCLGHPDFRLRHICKEDSEIVTQAFRHSCDTAEVFRQHYRLYDSAGKLRWFHDEASVVCDASGTPLFIRGTMLDITEKKEMEAELAKHRYYLEVNVEQRTAQLVKQLTVLESCNAALCDKLALARKHLALLNQHLPGVLGENEMSECDLS